MKIRSRTILILLFMTSQAVSVFAGVQDKDIPRLRNPFSESYLRENLKRSKPRMIYNEQIVGRLEGKIKSDPVIKNLPVLYPQNGGADVRIQIRMAGL